MAQVLQCSNGHFYDPDVYPSCPYCSGESMGVDRGATAPIIRNTFATVPQDIMATVPLNQAAETVPPEKPDNGISHTMPVQMINHNPATAQSVSGVGNVEGFQQPSADIVDDSKFVVGWLVAVEGPYRGKSFEIYNGYTDIGRTGGDIILAMDAQASSVKNVSTVYDAENNCFFVAAGVSRNLAYVNGKALISGCSVELNAYNSIKVGSTKLLFVPFCSPEFNWRDGETKKEK